MDNGIKITKVISLRASHLISVMTTHSWLVSWQRVNCQAHPLKRLQRNWNQIFMQLPDAVFTARHRFILLLHCHLVKQLMKMIKIPSDRTIGGVICVSLIWWSALICVTMNISRWRMRARRESTWWQASRALSWCRDHEEKPTASQAWVCARDNSFRSLPECSF